MLHEIVKGTEACKVSRAIFLANCKGSFFKKIGYWEKQVPKYGSLKHIFERNEIMLVEEVHSLYANRLTH